MQELSERASIPVSQIEAIEANQGMPSLAPLIAIARVLGVRLGTFLDDNTALGPAVLRADNAVKSIHFANSSSDDRPHISYKPLASEKAGRHFDPFMIDVEPLDEGDFVLSSHEGEEFIYVLAGSLEINYGKETYVLNAGDSIYYDSIIAHHVHAATAEGAKILAVVYAPL